MRIMVLIAAVTSVSITRVSNDANLVVLPMGHQNGNGINGWEGINRKILIYKHLIYPQRFIK
jgi:hypothetical protein